MAAHATLELLDKALRADPNQAAWARRLGITRAALSIARARGRLSPTLAGQIADALGENVAVWMLIAAFEAEPDRPPLAALRRKLEKTLNS